MLTLPGTPMYQKRDPVKVSLAHVVGAPGHGAARQTTYTPPGMTVLLVHHFRRPGGGRSMKIFVHLVTDRKTYTR